MEESKIKVSAREKAKVKEKIKEKEKEKRKDKEVVAADEHALRSRPQAGLAVGEEPGRTQRELEREQPES